MSEATSPGEVIARQVKYWRGRRKLSAQALADRIADDGGTLDRPAIFKIENGKRGVSVEEWLQLAYALAVPPPLLFLDLASGGKVAIVPGAEVHPWGAWQWVAGDEPPLTSIRTSKRVAEWQNARLYVLLRRRASAAARAVEKADQALQVAEYTGNAEQIQAAKQEQIDAIRSLAAVYDEMVMNEMTPGPTDREVVELMRSLGMLKHPEAVQIYEPSPEEVEFWREWQ